MQQKSFSLSLAMGTISGCPGTDCHTRCPCLPIRTDFWVVSLPQANSTRDTDSLDTPESPWSICDPWLLRILDFKQTQLRLPSLITAQHALTLKDAPAEPVPRIGQCAFESHAVFHPFALAIRPDNLRDHRLHAPSLHGAARILKISHCLTKAGCTFAHSSRAVS